MNSKIEFQAAELRAIELLAPCGSYESAIAALNAGADAVYIGGPLFGARAAADNPDEEKLKTVIDYAHLHRRAVYLTLNTLLKEKELEHLYEYLAPLYEHGLDAVIVQDMGVFRYVKRVFPALDIHCSTQMTITGPYGVSFLQQQGASRVVLARELSLVEVKDICQKTDIEIECFVHGALCYCYSGQCLLSSFIGGRSGNRGRCAQPCRLSYRQNGTEGYYLSPRDICTLDMIPDLVEAGIYSFKIEGRMKRPEYSAGVTRIYRKYLDLYRENGRDGFRIEEADMTELLDLYNRGGFSHGYMSADDPRKMNRAEMMALERPGHQGVSVGAVSGVSKDQISVRLEKPVKAGDILEIAAADKMRTYEFTVAVSDVSEHQPGTELALQSKDSRIFETGMPVIRTHRKALLEELRQIYIDEKIKEKINGKLILRKGIPATLISEYTQADGRVITAEVHADPPQAARKQPVEEARVRDIMQQTGASPFAFDQLKIEMDRDLFIPVQQLKSLRRQALEELEQHIYAAYRRVPAVERVPWKQSSSISKVVPQIHVVTERAEQAAELSRSDVGDVISLDLAFYDLNCDTDHELLCEVVHEIRAAGRECRIFLPHIFRENISGGAGIYEKLLALEADALVVRNTDSFAFLKEQGFTGRIFLDYTMYTLSSEAGRFWEEQGVAGDTAPLELNQRELMERGCNQSEVVVYGYVPVMITAGCIRSATRKGTAGCKRDGGEQYLTDRKEARYRVKNCCAHCYNLMYSSEPFRPGGKAAELRELKPAGVRIIGTTESTAQLAQIVEETMRGF